MAPGDAEYNPPNEHLDFSEIYTKWDLLKNHMNSGLANTGKVRDDQMRTTINRKLVETGERERLKELLRQRLIECGWRDELKAYCKEVVRQKGLEHITVDDLVSEITPKGRSLVPDQVKKELLQRIRSFLAQQSNM